MLSSLDVVAADGERLSFSHPSPAQVRRYAETLATLPTHRQAQELYSAIKEVSIVKESPEQRIKLLGIFHTQLLDTAHALIEQTSVSRDINKTISLALALLKYLYSGYKQVISGSINSDALNAGLLTNSIFSALSVLHEVFVCYWRHHLSPPTSFWLELHTLYAIAQELGLENQRISFVSARGKPNTGIRNSYLKTLLASSICPPRYNAGELKQILQFVDAWSHLAELSPSKQDSLFVVDPQKSYGPVYRTRIKKIRKDHLSLCPKNLLTALQDRCIKSDSDIEYITLPDRLITDLSRYWDQENLRQEDHAKSQGFVDLVVGINDIHQMMTGTEFGEEYFTSLEQSTNSTPEPNASRSGHWRYPSFRCEYLDKSTSGCCIEADGLREVLSPGEIVTLIDSESEHQVTGIIRWVHNTAEMRTRVGIEQFTGELKACAVCLTRSTKPVTPYLPAFTITSSKNKKDVRLLAPSIPLKTHSQVHLITDQQEGYFSLREKVDMTFYISHFKITAEDKPKEKIDRDANK